MTHADLLKLADVHAPELMDKTASALQELEALSLEDAVETTVEFSTILDHAGAKTKEAGWKDSLHAVSGQMGDSARRAGSSAGKFGREVGGAAAKGSPSPSSPASAPRSPPTSTTPPGAASPRAATGSG